MLSCRFAESKVRWTSRVLWMAVVSQSSVKSSRRNSASSSVGANPFLLYCIELYFYLGIPNSDSSFACEYSFLLVFCLREAKDSLRLGEILSQPPSKQVYYFIPFVMVSTLAFSPVWFEKAMENTSLQYRDISQLWFNKAALVYRETSTVVLKAISTEYR